MTTDLAVQDHELAQTPANLFGTANPVEVVERSTEIAKALADVLSNRQLAKKIGNRSFVLVEGWTLLGTMLGVFPVVEWTRPLTKDGQPNGWEARVEARTLSGQVVGAAEAECTRDENPWSWAPTGRNGQKLQPRDDYALRSMAQTRATSKALRGPLGFIVELAGYSATPAEEIPDTEPAGDLTRLNAVLKELEPITLPEGHTSWKALAKDYSMSRFGVADSKKLSQEQVGDLTAYLESFVIPL